MSDDVREKAIEAAWLAYTEHAHEWSELTTEQLQGAALPNCVARGDLREAYAFRAAIAAFENAMWHLSVEQMRNLLPAPPEVV